MTFEYRPTGVCSRRFVFEIDNNIIESAYVEGGCHGNLQGISSLIKGMNVNEVIAKLEGIKCGGKPTSCPDQIAKAMHAFLEKK